MSIELIQRDAEKLLLDQLQQSHGGHWGAVHFACGALPNRPNESTLLLAMKPVVGDRNARLYFLAGGDIMITFHGQQTAARDALRRTLYSQFKIDAESKLDHYYDAQAHTEELRNFCMQRLAAVQKMAELVATPATAAGKLAQSAASSLVMNNFHVEQFSEAKYSRPYRWRPDILIVDDQLFTQSLLQNVLGRQFKVNVAGDALTAWDLYFKYAPDIVFLDIEMPGINGHELAAALVRDDPDAFIVMVTANNYAQDVARARQNGAKGFIVKPFNKQKILDAIDKFTQTKKTS